MRAHHERWRALAAAFSGRRGAPALVLLVVFLVSFHAERALGMGASTALAAPVGSAAAGEVELAICGLDDISMSDGAPACGADAGFEDGLDAGSPAKARDSGADPTRYHTHHAAPHAAPSAAPLRARSDDPAVDPTAVDPTAVDPTAVDPPADPTARLAPMCDNDAASVAVAAEVPEIDRGRIEPLPCDVEHLLARLRSDDRARGASVVSGRGWGEPEPQQIQVSSERFDAASGPCARWPMRAEPAAITLGTSRGLAGRRGHFSRVERPPSLRG